MKPLFEKKGKAPEPASDWSISSYNFSKLPHITVVRSEEDHLSDSMRSLPTLPFDRVVIHCHRSPTPHQVVLLYELRRVVVPDESTLLLFHHRGGKITKRWRTAMRLMSFPPVRSDGFVSVWNGPDDFKTPRCKTEVPLEEQPKRFYRRLLQGSKRVLEVFPRVGVVSKTALSLGIPVTVFLSGRDTKTSSLIEQLGGQFP